MLDFCKVLPSCRHLMSMSFLTFILLLKGFDRKGVASTSNVMELLRVLFKYLGQMSRLSFQPFEDLRLDVKLLPHLVSIFLF
ncbi:hypothetical protein O6H91_18G011200 [Diphasiastrum complanatum]|uniref:Uncharacterized protein n=1 Tax=Diphasiastrum complanatum TaxID=34168 RepID=A0ACC2AYA2_DIPCM|nr:hypothetical protein O6H91_18G011200 [Diphasiastrum complanatum]